MIPICIFYLNVNYVKYENVRLTFSISVLSLYRIILNNNVMKTSIIFVLAFLLFTVKSSGTVHVITQNGFSFSPSSLTVSIGDTIRWQWTAGSHTTTSISVPDGAQSWNNPLNSSSVSFDYKIEVAGDYSYVCTPHQGLGMAGSFTALGFTSLNENISSVRFSVINPFDESLKIYSSEGSALLLTLWDLTGKVVLRTEFNGYGTENIVTESWPDGIYILSVKRKDNGKETVKKITKSGR